MQNKDLRKNHQDITQGALQEADADAERRIDRCPPELLQSGHASDQHPQLAEALVEATLALNGSLDRNEVLDQILEQTQRVICCNAVAVMLIREKEVYAARYRGWETGEGVPLTPDGTDVPKIILAAELNQALTHPDLSEMAGEPLNWQRLPGFEWVKSSISIPLQGREGALGFLGIISSQPDAFDEEMVGILSAFAAHATLAIQNAELYASVIKARQIAETLSSASMALTRTLDLDIVLRTLLDHLGRLVSYDDACVMLLLDHTQLVVRAVQSNGDLGQSQHVLTQTVDATLSPLLGQLIATGEGILIPDTSEHPGWTHPTRAQHVGSWLGVPLVAEAGVIGICALDKIEHGFFNQQHLHLATALVRQAAIAVQNAWLFSQVSDARSRLQSLSQRLVEVQEAERRYVARELHDETGQALTSLAVGLRLLERQADQPEKVVRTLRDLGHTVETVSEDLHRLAMALRPASLDHLGLVLALRQYAESVGERHGLKVDFEATGFQRRLPVDLETALFRIVQEALTNVIRHANATHVDIVLQHFGDKLNVIVEDNGVGFKAGTDSSSEHLGLIGIRERAEMLGGKLVLDSTPGSGTTLSVEVPHAVTDTHR